MQQLNIEELKKARDLIIQESKKPAIQDSALSDSQVINELYELYIQVKNAEKRNINHR